MPTQSATAFYDDTVADVFVPEIWSQEEIRAREAKLHFASLFDRKYEKEVAKYGDTIHVPSIGHFTAMTKDLTTTTGGTVTSTGATQFETITETNTNIIINRWIFSAMAVNTATRVHSNRDLMTAYAPEMGYALALDVDDILAGLPDDFSNSVGSLTVELTYENALRAIQYIDDADAPENDRHWVISPAQRAGFMKLDAFVHGDYSKLNSDVNETVRAGNIGTWMNVPVHCSTNVEGTNAAGHDNTLFQKEAVALCIQMKPVTHHQYDIDRMCDKVLSESMYGTKEMRDDHGVWAKGA